jgi:hypothetical protein
MDTIWKCKSNDLTQSKYWERTHKFDLKIPKMVAQAQAINKEDGNMLWWDSIIMEMKNVWPAFEWREKTEQGKLPVGYKMWNPILTHPASIYLLGV